MRATERADSAALSVLNAGYGDGMSGAKVGSLIGAVGGLTFIASNAGVLPGAWPLVLRLVGICTFMLVVALILRADIIGRGVAPTRAQLRNYGFTVLAEVLAIVVGSRILVSVFDLAEATLPWVATVVGAHFVVFARIFKEPVFAGLGIPMTTFGLAGMVVAARGAAKSTIGVVGGIVPGSILLVAVGWSAWVGHRSKA